MCRKQVALPGAASAHDHLQVARYAQQHRRLQFLPSDCKQIHRSQAFPHTATQHARTKPQFTQKRTPEQFSAIYSTKSSVVVFMIWTTASKVLHLPKIVTPAHWCTHGLWCSRWIRWCSRWIRWCVTRWGRCQHSLWKHISVGWQQDEGMGPRIHCIPRSYGCDCFGRFRCNSRLVNLRDSTVVGAVTVVSDA